MTNVSTVFGNLNEQDLKALKASLREISNAMTRIKSEQEDIKSEIDALFDKYKIPKKIIRRIIKSYHKQNFQEELLEDKEFEAIYTGIVEQ